MSTIRNGFDRASIVARSLDWKRQAPSFVHDGSLRDVVVENAAMSEWRAVVDFILCAYGSAKLTKQGRTLDSLPDRTELVFEEVQYTLSFELGTIQLASHFLSADVIESSFDPREVSEQSLSDLLGFLVDLGELTGKRAIISPENAPESPIFLYAPDLRRIDWIPDKREHV